MSDNPEETETKTEENSEIENTNPSETIDQTEVPEENLQSAEAPSPEPDTEPKPEASVEPQPEVSAEPQPQPQRNAEPKAESRSAESLVNDSDVNIDTLLKVPVSVAIEVGRTKMILSDLLETQEGTVIELERLLEEPLDILVNGALIAHGVVVLANDKFGIQITDIISQQERAQSL